MLREFLYIGDRRNFRRYLKFFLFDENRFYSFCDLLLQFGEIARRIRRVSDNAAMLDVEWELRRSLFATDKHDLLLGCDRVALFKPDVWIIGRNLRKTHGGFLDFVFNLIDWNRHAGVPINTICAQLGAFDSRGKDVFESLIVGSSVNKLNDKASSHDVSKLDELGPESEAGGILRVGDFAGKNY